MGVRHLYVEVCVVRNGHELDVAQPPQYGIVRPGKVHHLELHPLGVEIRGISEHDR